MLIFSNPKSLTQPKVYVKKFQKLGIIFSPFFEYFEMAFKKGLTGLKKETSLTGLASAASPPNRPVSKIKSNLIFDQDIKHNKSFSKILNNEIIINTVKKSAVFCYLL